MDEALERERLLDWQPQLASVNIEIKSPTDRAYNCVAWAAGDDTKFWSPAVGVGGKLLGGYYWPPDVEVLPTVTATEKVFEGRGFVRTSLTDIALELGVEKVAIFGQDAMGFVTHAARQVASGRWASKMGDNADIEHDLHDVEGSIFGEVRSVMRKESAATSAPDVGPASADLLIPQRRTR